MFAALQTARPIAAYALVQCLLMCIINLGAPPNNKCSICCAAPRAAARERACGRAQDCQGGGMTGGPTLRVFGRARKKRTVCSGHRPRMLFAFALLFAAHRRARSSSASLVCPPARPLALCLRWWLCEPQPTTSRAAAECSIGAQIGQR